MQSVEWPRYSEMAPSGFEPRLDRPPYHAQSDYDGNSTAQREKEDVHGMFVMQIEEARGMYDFPLMLVLSNAVLTSAALPITRPSVPRRSLRKLVASQRSKPTKQRWALS